jgi:predicted transcriptional regulator
LDILVLQRKGLTQRQIAKKLGISRNTVKKYIENQGYPERDRSQPNRKSLLDQFQGNIAAWLEEDMEYKATWIYDHLRPMGFSGLSRSEKYLNKFALFRNSLFKRLIYWSSIHNYYSTY